MHQRFASKLVPWLLALLAAPSWAATHNVTVGGAATAFSPQTVTIDVGDTVVWTNVGGTHDIRADNGSFSSGPAAGDPWTFSRTFNAAGTFGYHCSIHGLPGQFMFGTVIVQGGPPEAPSGLQAQATSTSEISLAWTDNSSNETGFRIERRTVDGTFQEVATAGAGATGAAVPGMSPSTFYLFRVRAAGADGTFSGYSNEAGAAALGEIAPCVSGAETLCLNGGRFRVEVDFRSSLGPGQGKAVSLPSAPDSGLFYFFSAANIEMLIKVLNACVDPFNHYWVFYAATTNVEFAVVVTDTMAGQTRGYFNPLGQTAPPVQDVEAFATCP